jgi:hypothetical protein
MLRFRSTPTLAALVVLAACNSDSTRSGDEFVANRVVARVQKADSRQELKLDAPLMGIHVYSALDPSRAFTMLLGADPFGESEMGPMLQLIVPGVLTARGYPVGSLDITAEEEMSPAEITTTLGIVVAPEPDGDDMDFFTTTGGTVDVVTADLGSVTRPGRVQARVALDLREFYFDREPAGYGKQATGKGSLDGPLMQSVASDAEVAFTGAFTGSTRRDLMGGMFGEEPGLEPGVRRHWSFTVSTPGSAPRGGSFGYLSLRLGRIPATGQTVRFTMVQPDTTWGRPGPADTASSAELQVIGPGDTPDTLSWDPPTYLSTSGELRVESATAQAIRGTLTLTLTEYDFRTGRLGTRTVTASGRVGLSLTDAPPFFSRAPAVRAHRAASRRTFQLGAARR